MIKRDMALKCFSFLLTSRKLEGQADHFDHLSAFTKAHLSQVCQKERWMSRWSFKKDVLIMLGDLLQRVWYTYSLTMFFPDIHDFLLIEILVPFLKSNLVKSRCFAPLTWQAYWDKESIFLTGASTQLTNLGLLIPKKLKQQHYY